MSSYRRLLLIINPKAGVKKKESTLTDIILTFSDHYYETIVCFTEAAGDGTRLVREHMDDSIDRIVCMGGDGTLSEVIAGCRRYSWDKPLGYIPAGSTNDFATSLQLPLTPVEAAERAVTGRPHRHDLGSFNGRHFIYTASCGIFTRASYETSQKVKNVLGHMAYVLEGIKEIPQTHSYHMKVVVDGHVYEDNYIFVSICNTFSLGGVMNFDEKTVDMGDGLFELLLISKPKDISQLRTIINALKEQKYDTPLVTFLQVDQVLVNCAEKPDWSLDGEKAEGQENCEFSVIPGGIQMIY